MVRHPCCRATTSTSTPSRRKAALRLSTAVALLLLTTAANAATLVVRRTGGGGAKNRADRLPSAGAAPSLSSSFATEVASRGQRHRRRLGKDKEVDAGDGQVQPPPPDASLTTEPTAEPTPKRDASGGDGGGDGPAPAPAPAPTKKPSSGTSGGGTDNNGSAENPPTNSSSPSGGGGGNDGEPSSIAVDLLEFTVTYDATNSTTQADDVVASIHATLFDGLQEAYPTLTSVVLEEPDSRRRHRVRLLQQVPRLGQPQELRNLVSAELTLGGKALFDGTAPAAADVQELQTSLLEQWQGGTVSVAASAAQAPGGTGGSGSATPESSSSSPNAGLIGGIVAAAAIVLVVGAVVANRYSRRRRVQHERDGGSGGVRVEILSEVLDDEDGDEWGTLKARRTLSTEHAECDIEIEDRNGDVTVTTSPTTNGAPRPMMPESQQPADPHPDSVYLDEAATLASDSVDSREDRAALGSLLKFFKAQSVDCCPSNKSSQTPGADVPTQKVEEPEEKKDDNDVDDSNDNAPRSPTQALPPSLATADDPPTASPAILPSPSGDSMDDYSLASASFGPKPQLPATKWMEASNSPAREEYHSDNESQFTYGDVGAASVASVPTVPPPSAAGAGGGLLGPPPTHQNRAFSSDDDNDSIEAIMAMSPSSPPPLLVSPSTASRTPTRPKKAASKASPTSIVASLTATGSPASLPSSPPTGTGAATRKQLWPRSAADDAQTPFDEALEDDVHDDLEGFAAELERSQSRYAQHPPEFSPPRGVDPPASKALLPNAARQQNLPLRPAGSFSSATGGQEETLSSYLRTKRGEAREQRTFL